MTGGQLVKLDYLLETKARMTPVIQAAGSGLPRHFEASTFGIALTTSFDERALR